MFNKIGLGGFLTFNSRQAERNIKRTNTAFRGMRTSAIGAGSAVKKTGRATALSSGVFSGAATALVPLVAAGGAAVKTYSDFTKQMSALKAVGQLNEEQFASLREEAIRLGGSTAFTATEAAQGMEELKRAGFSVGEVMSATGAALNLASSDAIGLADSSRIMANVIRSLGLSAADDAQRVADVLASTSSKSNTSVLALGESFKMSAATMRLFGIELEEGAAIMGKLADSGLRGTQGGTAFNNMMNKLSRPTKKGLALLEDFDLKLTKTDGSMRKVSDITRDLAAGLSGITDDGKRVAAAMELTGLRGVKAFNALSNSLSADVTLEELEEQLKGANGAAKTMSDERLNNLAGKFTLLKSAAEGFTIRMLDMFKGLDGSGLAPILDAIVLVNGAWDEMNRLVNAGADDTEAFEKVSESFGSTIAGVVFGIRDGIDEIQVVIKTVVSQLAKWGAAFEETLGGSGVRKLTKFITMFAGLSVVLSPLAVALLGIGYVLATVVIPAASAAGAALAAAFWPVILVAGILTAAYFALRNENESLEETATRAWRAIKSAALDLWVNVLQPMWQGMSEAAALVWPEIQASAMAVFGTLRNLVNEFIALWGAMTQGSTADWRKIGRVVVQVGAVIVNVVLKTILTALNIVRNGVMQVRQIFIDLGQGKTRESLRRLAGLIINTLVLPLRGVAGILASLMESALAIPGAAAALGETKVASLKTSTAAIRKFGEQGFDLGGGRVPLAEVGEADDVVASFGAGDKDLLSEFTEIDADKTTSETDRITNVGKGIRSDVKAGIKAGLEETTLESNVTTEVNLDNKTIARGQARHRQDVSDRLGFKTPPLARRISAEQGSPS